MNEYWCGLRVLRRVRHGDLHANWTRRAVHVYHSDYVTLIGHERITFFRMFLPASEGDT